MFAISLLAVDMLVHCGLGNPQQLSYGILSQLVIQVIHPYYFELSCRQMLSHEVEQEGNDFGISSSPIYIGLVVAVGATDLGTIRYVVPLLKSQVSSPI